MWLRTSMLADSFNNISMSHIEKYLKPKININEVSTKNKNKIV